MANPLDLHLRHVKQGLRYLKGTKTLGIVYSYNSHVNTNTPIYLIYSDATWGSKEDRKSLYG